MDAETNRVPATITVYTGIIGGVHIGQPIDITVKSGEGVGVAFAPTWDMVKGYKVWCGDMRFKAKPLSPEAYTERYLALMRKRYSQDPEGFIGIFTHSIITLQCYCRGSFCHRFIVAEHILPAIANKLHICYNYSDDLYNERRRR